MKKNNLVDEFAGKIPFSIYNGALLSNEGELTLIDGGVDGVVKRSCFSDTEVDSRSDISISLDEIITKP